MTRPVVDGLIRPGVSPNLITTVGRCWWWPRRSPLRSGHIRLGGLLYLVSGIVDTLDGAVARANGQVTKFGAFYDSTLDRVGDGATFMGIAVYYLMAPPDPVAWREGAVIICDGGDHRLAAGVVCPGPGRGPGHRLQGRDGPAGGADRAARSPHGDLRRGTPRPDSLRDRDAARRDVGDHRSAALRICLSGD